MPRWLDDRDALAASQRRSAAVARDWLAGEPHRALAAGFDAVPAGDADAAAEVAEALFADTGWLAALLAPLTVALRADPAFEPPLRVHRDPLRIGAVLLDHPAVSITATTLSADALAALPPPRTVVVPGRLTVVRYHRAGGARWRGWEAGEAGPGFRADDAPPCRALPDRALADGLVVRHDGRRRGGMLAGARGDVTTLTATIRYAPAPLMREYAVATGALERVASLDEAGSRVTMLLTLLRVSGRHDAAAAFDGATRTAAFHGRWAAMREWLALDVAAALPRLAEMAAHDPHDEVRAAARATLIAARERIAA